MLETKKTVLLASNAKVDDVTVVQLNATIDVNEGAPTTYNEFIVDQEAYRAHRTEIRADMEAFRQEMYKIEDSEINAEPQPEEVKLKK